MRDSGYELENKKEMSMKNKGIILMIAVLAALLSGCGSSMYKEGGEAIVEMEAIRQAESW